MKLKMLALLPLIFLTAPAQAYQELKQTAADWKFDGHTIKNCANSQKVEVSPETMGTYTGSIQVIAQPGDFNHFQRMGQLLFSVDLGSAGIERLKIWSNDQNGVKPFEFEFPSLAVIAKGGACALSGYDANHGLYIELDDPKWGAEHVGVKLHYRIEVKADNGGVKLSIVHSLWEWSPIVVVEAVALVPLWSGDYLFQKNISLKHTVQP